MADAKDGEFKSSILGPDGSSLVTSNLDAEFKMLKNISSDVKSGGPGNSLVNIPRERLKKMASQFNGMRPGLHRQSPSFYHPLFESINLQLPTKSFYPGTLITMADGTQKAIEEFSPGDEVISHDGSIEVVEFTEHHPATGGTVEVTAQGMDLPLRVTSGHRVYTLRAEDVECDREKKPGFCSLGAGTHCKRISSEPGRKGGPRCESRQEPIKDPYLLEAFKLRKGDYVFVPIVGGVETMRPFSEQRYNPATNSFMRVREVSVDFKMMRLLGYYASEGSTAKRPDGEIHSTVFSFNVTEKDTLAAEVVSLISDVFGKKAWVAIGQNNTCNVQVSGKNIGEWFVRHCGKLSKEKALSREVMFADPSLQIHFLATYANGDGYQVHGNSSAGKIVITTASEDMANQLAILARRCGMAPTKRYEYRKDGFAGKNAGRPTWNWRVGISSGFACPLIEVSKFKKHDKSFSMNKMVIHKKWVAHKITSVREVDYGGEVWNIGVRKPVKVLVPYNEPHLLLHGRARGGRPFEVYVKISGTSTDGNHSVIANGFACSQSREINQWARHFYKCLAPGTLVLMADSTLKEIENVAIGDRVITHDGTVGKVNEVFERKVKTKAVKVKSVGLLEITATRNHPFYVLDKSAEKWRWGHTKEVPAPEWRYAVNIKEGDFLLSPKVRTEHRELSGASGGIMVKASLKMARMIGFYAAEGSVSNGKGGRYVRFHFHAKERNTIGAETEASLKEFFPEGNPRWYGDGNSNGVELRVWDQNAAEFFSSMCPGNARTKRVSEFIMDASVEEQMDFLRAFVLGDGHVNRETGANPGQITINLASRDLSSQVQQMFIRCGMAATILHYFPSYSYKGKRMKSEAWQVRIAPLDAEKLIGKVKESESKSRNNSHHWFFGDHMVSRIKKVDTVEYDDYVYNLNVGPNNSFVANGAIVHNTDGYVGTMIDLHSEFPLTGMHIVCDDPKIKRFFEILFFDIIKGPRLLGEINLEWWKLANVYPFGSWDDNQGIWTGFKLLNPDFVEVEKSSLVDEPVLKLDPDDNLKRIVSSRNPKDLYDQLAKIENGELVNLVARGEKIPLNKFRVSHLAFKLSPYETVGTPIMFRAFKPLIMKDQIRRVQQAIYERHILPLKIIKVGSDNMPANPEAIKQVREAFDELSQDLSAWFVYHHAIQAEYVSSAGKIHSFESESKWVREEILAALLGNEAMVGGTGPNFACQDEESEILTANGFKKWNEVKVGDLAAAVDPDSGEISLDPIKEVLIYDYDSKKHGPMVHIKNSKIDHLITQNHRIPVRLRHSLYSGGGRKAGKKQYYDEKFSVRWANSIKSGRSMLRSEVSWMGSGVVNSVKFGYRDIPLMEYVKFAGWFASEGHTVFNAKTYTYRVGISQADHSQHVDEMESVLSNFGFKRYRQKGKYNGRDYHKSDFIISGKMLAKQIGDDFGVGSHNKKIPQWLKNLPVRYLSVMLRCLIDGDGNRRAATKKKKTKKIYYTYASVSKQLSDDVYEISLKCGYVPVMRFGQGKWWVYFSDGEAGRFPMIKMDNVKDVPYKGKVWCVNVPPRHFFISRRNGKTVVTGNTASIGMQILINRYIRNQQMLSDWIKETIFRPVAIAQDFMRKTEWGDELIVPEVEFEFMKLKDDAQMKGLMKELMKTGLISKQTFYTYMGLDADREKNQIAREQTEARRDVMQKIKPGAPGGPAGGGAMPPMGGGGGGGGEVPGAPEVPEAGPPTPGERMPAAETIPGATEGGQGPGPGGLPEAA